MQEITGKKSPIRFKSDQKMEFVIINGGLE